MRLDLRRVGREAQPVVTIDDFAPDPDALRAAAAAAAFAPARHLYPGVRAELPADYWPRQQAIVAQAVAAMLGHKAALTLIDASFSIVASPREALTIGQRLPHADARAAGRIALVHYLVDAGEGGGTAFYRHRSTGFETIDARRAAIYDGQLDAELRYGGPPPADYPQADDRLFERIGMVEARRNRAVLYPGFLLHSGVIPAAAPLSPDPMRGRLTITGFLSAAPAPPAS